MNDNYYLTAEVNNDYKYNMFRMNNISNVNIENNEFKDNLINFTCGDADSSKELVTDLSVIQGFLPDGHPDLVTTGNKEVKDISKTFTIRVTSKEVKRIKI